jgi:hypothetical protein
MMTKVSKIIFVKRMSGPPMFIQLPTPSNSPDAPASLAVSQPNQENGRLQPPRNSTAAMRLNTPAVANSAMKKMRNRKPEYSVM